MFKTQELAVHPSYQHYCLLQNTSLCPVSPVCAQEVGTSVSHSGTLIGRHRVAAGKSQKCLSMKLHCILPQ